jgi:hypothetical protein
LVLTMTGDRGPPAFAEPRLGRALQRKSDFHSARYTSGTGSYRGRSRIRVESGHKPKLGSVREGLPCGTVASVVPVREILANGRADFRQIRNVTQPCGLPRAMRGALSSRQGFPTLFARRPRRSRRWDSDACKLDRLGRSLPQHSHRPQGSLHRLPFSDRAEDRRPGRHGRSRFRGSSHTG